MATSIHRRGHYFSKPLYKGNDPKSELARRAAFVQQSVFYKRAKELSDRELVPVKTNIQAALQRKVKRISFGNLSSSEKRVFFVIGMMAFLSHIIPAAGQFYEADDRPSYWSQAAFGATYQPNPFNLEASERLADRFRSTPGELNSISEAVRSNFEGIWDRTVSGLDGFSGKFDNFLKGDGEISFWDQAAFGATYQPNPFNLEASERLADRFRSTPGSREISSELYSRSKRAGETWDKIDEFMRTPILGERERDRPFVPGNFPPYIRSSGDESFRSIESLVDRFNILPEQVRERTDFNEIMRAFAGQTMQNPDALFMPSEEVISKVLQDSPELEMDGYLKEKHIDISLAKHFANANLESKEEIRKGIDKVLGDLGLMPSVRIAMAMNLEPVLEKLSSRTITGAKYDNVVHYFKELASEKAAEVDSNTDFDPPHR